MLEQILRKRQVSDLLQISETTLWRWEKSGRFPSAKTIEGSSIKGWTESDVNKWIIDNFSNQKEL